MSTDPYSNEVRALFREPAHAGDLESGAKAHIDEQGVRLALAADVRDGRLATLRFRAWGCPHVIAAAEAFCANYEGRAVSELEAFSAQEIMQSLSVPAEKTGRILVLEDVVHALGQAVDRR